MNTDRRNAQIDNRRSALLISLTLAFLAGVGVAGMNTPTAAHSQPTETPTEQVVVDLTDEAVLEPDPMDPRPLDTAGDTDTIGEVQEVAPTPEPTIEGIKREYVKPEPEITGIKREMPISEDDPRWDCRTMGNHTCGVEIEGTWYVVEFDDAGEPISTTRR